MEKQYITCKNCEEQFEEDFAFCPHCGQKAKDELTIGVLFYNTISNYFSFDARFFKSFIPLMFKPGYLANKFIEGKRLLYLHPAQMYLFISVVFFFITSFAVREKTKKLDKELQNLDISTKNDSLNKSEPILDSIQIDEIMKPIKNNQKTFGIKSQDIKLLDSMVKTGNKKTENKVLTFNFDENKVDSLIAIGADDMDIYKVMGINENAGFLKRKFYSQMLKLYKEKGIGSILQASFDTIPIALFFLLPIFALILKLLYYKRGRFAHHLVFSFYFFSFLFTAFSIIYGINLIWDVPDWIDAVLVFFTFFYLLVALKRFYKQGWFLSLIKTSITTGGFFLLLIPFSVAISIFAILFY